MNGVEYFDMDQGSLAWFQVRMGCATASEFATIMTKGRKAGEPSKVRRTYLLRLAGELLTGEHQDSYESEAMLRGKLMEDEARAYYAMRSKEDVSQVGFARIALGGGFAGASPDSVVGERGLLEVKTRAPHHHLAVLLDGVLPEEHRAQVQGQLWITGRDWCDYLSYWPKLRPLMVRVPRDDACIELLSREVETFLQELAATVQSVRDMG